MPRARSISIQSEVTPRRSPLPCTAPAWVIAEACSASASVIVDLPASGWLITANVRLRAASATTSLTGRSPLPAGGRAGPLLRLRPPAGGPEAVRPTPGWRFVTDSVVSRTLATTASRPGRPPLPALASARDRPDRRVDLNLG
ncbi:hypothetical protein Sru01_07690 [Sphaerisporangium rufum]|uniref:Uncharacterized protein n=1 Tax=Sphaerisporangium rufum TaxID=1381558 RepID=A0A919R2H2_9ACTN|nr:hypothetical protein Sru01_07690 [Sphaerisporangium rufum]